MLDGMGMESEKKENYRVQISMSLVKMSDALPSASNCPNTFSFLSSWR